MKAVLLRVGIDSGSGGIQGPLFEDGSFEFICIPDKAGTETYADVVGRQGRPHCDYFPIKKQAAAKHRYVHLDPEFETFTYGDPTPPKRSLRKLERGDYLIFYCGLQPWGEWATSSQQAAALYIIGYFVVDMAGFAESFPTSTLKKHFSKNFHVRHPSVYARQRHDLVLVKGNAESRLLQKAACISCVGRDKRGSPLKVLSPAMQKIFGTFGGKISIQRSPPRWIEPEFVDKSIAFVSNLT